MKRLLFLAAMASIVAWVPSERVTEARLAVHTLWPEVFRPEKMKKELETFLDANTDLKDLEKKERRKGPR
jgi:hypothetical protein